MSYESSSANIGKRTFHEEAKTTFPEQIVKKRRDADEMRAAGKRVGEVLRLLAVSEPTLSRWQSQYGGMKSEEVKRLKALDE